MNNTTPTTPTTPQNNTFNNPFPEERHHDPENERFLTLSRQVSELLSRLRLLEERYANLRREQQTTSQNMIENHQTLAKQQRKLSDDILNLKRTFHDFKDQLDNMKGELADTAKIHDFKVIERYLDYWEPLTFLTHDEAERLINQALKTKNI